MLRGKNNTLAISLYLDKFSQYKEMEKKFEPGFLFKVQRKWYCILSAYGGFNGISFIKK